MNIKVPEAMGAPVWTKSGGATVFDSTFSVTGNHLMVSGLSVSLTPGSSISSTKDVRVTAVDSINMEVSSKLSAGRDVRFTSGGSISTGELSEVKASEEIRLIAGQSINLGPASSLSSKHATRLAATAINFAQSSGIIAHKNIELFAGQAIVLGDSSRLVSGLDVAFEVGHGEIPLTATVPFENMPNSVITLAAPPLTERMFFLARKESLLLGLP